MAGRKGAKRKPAAPSAPPPQAASASPPFPLRPPTDLSAALIVAALALLFHLRLVFSSPSLGIAAFDNGQYYYWIHRFMRASLLRGELPLWNPWILGGVPFAANPQAAAFYPPTWLCALLPALAAQKIWIPLHSWIAGEGTRRLLRSQGVGPLAALLGAAAFMACGSFEARAAVAHFGRVMSQAWMPWAVWAFAQAIRHGGFRWPCAAGLAVAMQLLAGEPQMAYYTAIAMACWGGAEAIGAWRAEGAQSGARIVRRAGLAGALAVGVAVAASFAQLAITAQFARLSDRSGGSYEFATIGSLHPQDLGGMIVPWFAEKWGGVHAGSLYISHNWELAGYAGIVTLLLAGMAWTRRPSRAIAAAGAALAIALALALGKYTPFYRLALALPGFGFFRVPARAMALANLALAAMAAHGFVALFDAERARWKSFQWRAAAGAFFGVVVAALVLPFIAGKVVLSSTPSFGPVQQLAITPFHPVIFRALAVAAAGAGLAWAWGRMRREAAMLALAGLAAADLWSAVPRFELKDLAREAEGAVAQLAGMRAAGGAQPWRADLAMSPALPLNAAMEAGVENANGYWPFLPERYYRLACELRGARPESLRRSFLPYELYRPGTGDPLSALNVKWRHEIPPQTNAPAIRENPAALPRAWLVDRAEVLDGEAILARMKDPAFDPARVALLEEPPALSPIAGEGAPGTCSIAGRGDRWIEIDATAVRDAILVVSQNHYPGWRATIDGKRAELRRADYALASLSVPAGTHRVRLEYNPPWINGAIALTALAWIGLAAAIFPRGWKRRGGSAQEPNLEIR